LLNDTLPHRNDGDPDQAAWGSVPDRAGSVPREVQRIRQERDTEALNQMFSSVVPPVVPKAPKADKAK